MLETTFLQILQRLVLGCSVVVEETRVSAGGLTLANGGWYTKIARDVSGGFHTERLV